MEVQDVLPLRHRILRPHQSIQDCAFPQDQWLTTFHVGAISSGQVVSVATFHEEAFPKLPAKQPYRLRGMATDNNSQGKGIGRRVLELGIEELKSRGCDLLWCNAREIAFPFYEKIGMKYEGPMFDIPSIGPHKVMYLYLEA
jgi:GNAT superfamily N-acetyltransferase